jgi:BirA family biotin operon repressor/biotin-[acetyl-CoA-carboxylase] ligase
MLASLAVVHSIEAITGLKAQVKWPNDVLVNGRKVCGILIENDVRGDTVVYAVIGIGVNVNLSLSDVPEISSFATSLSDELGGDVSLLSLIRRLLADVEGLYLALLAGGSIYEEWRGSLVTLGRKVRVESGKNKYEGIAESVARDGSLLLRQANGSLTKIVAGDVTLRN